MSGANNAFSTDSQKRRFASPDVLLISLGMLLVVVLGIWAAVSAKKDYNFSATVALIKVGAPKDRVIARFGNPDKEQVSPPIFRRTQKFQHREHGSAYDLSSSTNAIRVLIWEGEKFSSSLICFASFDSEDKVVATGCGEI